MTTTATLIKGRATQRLYIFAEIDGARVNLTDKTLQCVMALTTGASPQALSADKPAQTGADVGKFYVDVTSANLAALSDPAQVLLSFNIWNTDDSLLLRGRATMKVEI